MFYRAATTKTFVSQCCLYRWHAEDYFEVEDRVVRIADVRQKATPAEFDREGFELLTRPTVVDDLNDDAAVEDAYYPEIKALLKERFAASRVVIFDATRRSDSG